MNYGNQLAFVLNPGAYIWGEIIGLFTGCNPVEPYAEEGEEFGC